MKILVVTNLYPPQNLGGYGRCLQDFTLSLLGRGHTLEVICADAPYLTESSSPITPVSVSAQHLSVSRLLRLKGSYENGVSLCTSPSICASIDDHNFSILSSSLKSRWDVVLVGNLDLLGPSIINFLTYHNFLFPCQVL